MNTPFKITGSLKIIKDDECFIDAKRVRLLELIKEQGSINTASKIMKMSYQQAWHFIKQMNNLSPLPVITKHRGGANGGGAIVTKYGERLITEFRQVEELHLKFKNELNNNLWLCSFNHQSFHEK